MPNERVTISTSDGECPCDVLIPPGQGPWPGVIFYMDAGGIRPAMIEMAQRAADDGYLVLLPDLFYRFGAYGPLVPAEVFAGDWRAILGPMMATTGNDKAAEDTQAFIAYLDTRSDFAGGKLGAAGFCMGGGMALAAAGTSSDRFAAVASFHGGNLATDAPTSPHLLAPKMKAENHIGAAENDGSYPPEMAKRLEDAFTHAGVRFDTKTYHAAHGWMMPDFPVYDHAEAERGWVEMLKLFARNVRDGG